MLFFKAEHIDINKTSHGSTLLDLGLENSTGDKREISTIKSGGLLYLFASYKYLAKNWVFMYVTLALCSVYFVVSGIQFWTTAYFLKVLNMNPSLVMLFFTF